MILAITNGSVIIDEDDLELVEKLRWHVSSTGYAVWRGYKNGKKQTIRMHRLITNCPNGMIVDHINHNKLDNRRANLRVCTQSDNMRNKLDLGKGYWLHSQNNNWVVEICGKHIGCFPTEEEASKVAELVRKGGEYQKPPREQCQYGHNLKDAYDYGNGKRCKQCQSRRSREYYVRKTKRQMAKNDGKENGV